MKLKVLRPFINKENKKQVFEAGAVIDIDDAARVNDIVKRGLGEIVIEQTEVDNTPAEGGASGDQPKGETPAKEKKSKGKTKKKAEGEQPATGEVDPAESEDSEKEE